MTVLRPLMLLTLLTGSVHTFSQSTLSGKLTDHQTGEPVPYASVYFANTTLGTSSQSDGAFFINKIPTGKFDLLVEVIGDRRFRMPIEFVQGGYHVDITLDQDTIQLHPVTVVAESDRKYFPVFTRYFIGDDKTAKRCTILNPEVLYFYFDADRNNLSVTAHQPVEVLNPDLGYKVYFTLDMFVLDFKAGSKLMQGIARFEELPVGGREDSNTRDKKRALAYRGSLFHFMRSLYNRTLNHEGFDLYTVDSVESSTGKTEVLHPTKETKSVSGDKVKQLNFQGLLKLEYRHEQDMSYPGRGAWARNPNGYQQTYLLLKNPCLEIYENGYYAEQNSVWMTGYLIWRETVSNMVPLGYEPVKKKQKH